jgi:hypothetical protein
MFLVALAALLAQTLPLIASAVEANRAVPAGARP